MGSIGFTGSRGGMTRDQLDMLTLLLVGVHPPYRTLRHGDCVGADATAAATARRLGFHIIGHPGYPNRPDPHNPWRAWFPSDVTFKPQPFLHRNRIIVNRSTVLLATPATFDPPRGRSGTWFTINYAVAVGKPTYIIRPDGTVAARNATVPTAAGERS